MSKTCIASNLRKLRRQKNLSQEKLAMELGIKRSNVASYENALAEPSASRLVKICHYFDVSMEDFICKEI